MVEASRPLLSLTLPLSPLASGPGLSEDFFATLAAQGLFQPLPNLSFGPPQNAQNNTSLLSPLASNRNTKRHVTTQAKPQPIPPRQIIALLNLLEQMDNDMVKEVQRVRESIKEARSDIAEYKRECFAQDCVIETRKARERRETKGIDDEFWLQV